MNEGITPARQAELIAAIEDHAARYTPQFSPIGMNDPARYVAEGHVPGGGAHGREWEWIEEYIRRHPEVLTRQPLTITELHLRDLQREANQRTARVKAREAHRAYRAGDHPTALQLLAAGEALWDGLDWAKWRAQVDEAANAT